MVRYPLISMRMRQWRRKGLWKILYALNPPCSASRFNSFWHGVIPTSYLNFTLVVNIVLGCQSL